MGAGRRGDGQEQAAVDGRRNRRGHRYCQEKRRRTRGERSGAAGASGRGAGRRADVLQRRSALLRHIAGRAEGGLYRQIREEHDPMVRGNARRMGRETLMRRVLRGAAVAPPARSFYRQTGTERLKTMRIIDKSMRGAGRTSHAPRVCALKERGKLCSNRTQGRFFLRRFRLSFSGR